MVFSNPKAVVLGLSQRAAKANTSPLLLRLPTSPWRYSGLGGTSRSAQRSYIALPGRGQPLCVTSDTSPQRNKPVRSSHLPRGLASNRYQPAHSRAASTMPSAVADNSPTVKVLVAGGSYAGLSTVVNLLDLGDGLSPRASPEPYAHHPDLAKVDFQITLVDERDGFCESRPSERPDSWVLMVLSPRRSPSYRIPPCPGGRYLC